MESLGATVQAEIKHVKESPMPLNFDFTTHSVGQASILELAGKTKIVNIICRYFGINMSKN